MSLNLEQVLTDFELAMQQATISNLGTVNNKKVELKGCWFHFNQALVRRLFSLGKI
jgi:hypothetical protein